MTGAHTEAVQHLLSLSEAAKRLAPSGHAIATDAERSRADFLVAFVEDGDLPMARVLFRELFGFTHALQASGLGGRRRQRVDAR